MIQLFTADDRARAEELDSTTTDKLTALGYFHGDNYYNSLDDALNALDDSIGHFMDDVSTLYDVARKLDYEIGEEDRLNRVLGCSAEAYEQLGSYISTDDIEQVLDTEWSLTIINGTCYENIGA